MAQRFSNLFMLGGVALVSASQCLFVVDPGEKALIMNQLSGLKQKVFHQGYNFKLPFVEVLSRISSLLSSMMLGLSPSTFM